MRAEQGDYEVSANAADLDVDVVHAYLERSYWAKGIPRALLERAIAGSLCFGLFYKGAQIGFARAVTDRATFAYLMDVFVLEDYRGHGLGKWMIEVVMQHPDLQGLRKFMLATRDAHGLYEAFSFSRLKCPDNVMEIVNPDIYSKP